MIREIKTTENPDQVFLLARRRQEVEAEFAARVYEEFNWGPARNKLQELAGYLLRLMAAGPAEALDAAIWDEHSIGILARVGRNRAGLELLGHPIHLRRLDATNCADIVRLAGTWVERGGLCMGAVAHIPSKKYPNEAAQKKETFRPEINKGAGYFWGEDARNRGGGWDVEAHLVPFMRDPNAFAGMKGKRAQGNSNVLQLDRLFGLIVACDISGTTADTLYWLNYFQDTLQFSKAFAMLPLGTIAHNMHHSVLEVAVVASLNKLMDYHIGFFETLKPTDCSCFPEELSGLARACADADARMIQEGLHHLRYYEDARPKGVFQITDVHVHQLRNSPISDAVTMLDRAPCLGGYPQRHSVVELLHSAGMMV